MKPKKKRRTFTAEFKADTVRLIRESGRSIGEVAKDLDLTEPALRYSVKQAQIDTFTPAGRLARVRGRDDGRHGMY